MTGSRVRDDDGWVLATVMSVLMVISLVSVAAFAATTNDIRGGANDVQAKQAYAAAEAGIQAYQYELGRDTDIWLDCETATAISVNPRVAKDAARTWVTLPNSTAQYAIEILPAPGYSKCTAGDEASVIDATSGTFRIRVTGRAMNKTTVVKRSLVATFRKPSFADYVYFTDSEGGNIRFVTGDSVNGPLHTNDQLLICGTPNFGQSPADPIETVKNGAANGWTADGSCSGSRPMANNVPGYTNPANGGSLGTWVNPAAALELPASNSDLRADTLPAYRFVGETWINFKGDGTMRVTGVREDGVSYTGAESIAQPANGLIYVSNGTCGGAYSPTNPYNATINGAGKCGTAWIQGTYTKSVTIGAAADIVVVGNFLKSGTAVAGLISNNYIRVYHPISPSNNNCTAGNANATIVPTAQNKPYHTITLPLNNIRIDAAILSLQQSFTVDSYMCGPRLSGTLNVTGAIAQKTRGAVGTSAPSGYLKNYVYDRRFKYRSPPFFLDPVRATWKITSQQEQVPAQ